MSRDAGPIGRPDALAGIEPFVRRVVSGGLALLAGLWLLALLDSSSPVWLLGPVLVFGGVASLAAGIARPLEVDWLGWAG